MSSDFDDESFQEDPILGDMTLDAEKCLDTIGSSVICSPMATTSLFMMI